LILLAHAQTRAAVVSKVDDVVVVVFVELLDVDFRADQDRLV
jgi:hypothetical protein